MPHLVRKPAIPSKVHGGVLLCTNEKRMQLRTFYKHQPIKGALFLNNQKCHYVVKAETVQFVLN